MAIMADSHLMNDVEIVIYEHLVPGSILLMFNTAGDS